MRFSMIRAGVVASAAAIALAACGGHALVPSQSAAPGSDAVISRPAKNPCYTSAVQPTWIFKGSCTISTLPATGATFKLAPYTRNQIVVTAKVPKNTGNGAPFVVVDAKGGAAKDIMPYKGMKFVPFKAPALKSLIYVQAVNGFGCVKPSSKCPGLRFTGPYLVYSVRAKTFPGTNCYLSLLEQTKKGPAWLTPGLTGAVKKGVMTIKAPSSGLANFFPYGIPKGPLFVNVSCK